MSKTAWTTSRMSRHTRRSGTPSSTCDYAISNDETAATRPHDVGTWTRLARPRCSIGQEERCPHGFSYPSTPARVWTQRTNARQNHHRPHEVSHQSSAFPDV